MLGSTTKTVAPKTPQAATRYPRFALFWHEENGKRGMYRTRRKKAISFRLDGLYKAREAHFKLVYGVRKGEFLQNESISYQLPKQLQQLKRDWRTFSSDAELKAAMEYVA